jgi:hypothetical protein
MKKSSITSILFLSFISNLIYQFVKNKYQNFCLTVSGRKPVKELSSFKRLE